MMNPELPDLNRPGPADEMALRERGPFTSLLLGAGVLAPLALVVLSVVSGKNLWVTLLNLVGMYGGLFVMVQGWRADRPRKVTVGGWCMAGSLLACLTALSLLQ